jgi:phosphoglycerol transferase MdoB-like AlkP superfamily enzyme
MIIAFIDIPVFFFIAYNYLKIYELRKKIILYRMMAVLASIAVIIAVQVSYYNNNNFITTIMRDKYRGESPIVQWYGTLSNNVASIWRKGNENKLINHFMYGSQLSGNKNSNANPNFVLIQVEAMDANIINKKYKDKFIMPYLKSLSDKNIYYPYLMSYHKGGGTSDSEFSIINSIEPLDGYPSIKLSNYSYENSMLKRLSDSGYTNVAFHGNSDVFFNRDTAFPKMGFNEFYDIDKMGLKHKGWGAPDKDVFDFASKTIKASEEPYLSYIITMTSHTPFTNVNNYFSKSIYNDITTKSVRNYFNSMSYVDECIKKFIDEIKNDNTYILIFGDHTPNVNADTYKQASFTEEGKYFEFVPLIIITPDNKKYKSIKEVASFLDISPTILKNSGISFNIRSDGKDLIDVNSDSKEIPFKGSKYGREYLLEKIQEQ